MSCIFGSLMPLMPKRICFYDEQIPGDALLLLQWLHEDKNQSVLYSASIMHLC